MQGVDGPYRDGSLDSSFMALPDNRLYYGDNLDVLRRHIADESVDLVYLDPPFNSDANYNVLFAEKDGTQAAGQIQVFEDTWRWDESAARQFAETVEQGGRVADVLLAFERFLSHSDMLAYLVMMAPRLVELRRVLRDTGSIWLHCDPTASHYLKLLLDAVFGPQNFRTEVIWKRTSAHSDARRRFGDQHDVLLHFAKGPNSTFNTLYQPYSDSYLRSHYSNVDEKGRRYTTRDLRSPHPRPNLTYDYKGYKPHANGWSVSLEKMKELDAAGLLYFPESKAGRIRVKRFLDEMPGMSVGSVWDDISPINSQAQERLGYPTQKPEALLERIIAASCNEGDTVLDPFCGCGTTIAAAQKMQRRWIGIDITHLAISLIKVRLRDAFGDMARYQVIGEPTTAEDAAALAGSDKYQFQWWALGLVGARPTDQKKGADKGIDGRLYFHDGENARQIIFSVKGGKLKATDVRDLRGVLDREKAEIGVLLSFEPPTKQMRTEAASAGFYKSRWGNHPRLQLLTVAELLDGKGIDRPPVTGSNVTYKQAPRSIKKVAEPRTLFEPERDD